MKPLAWPLACYLAMTIVVPILDGAPVDGEHAATVMAMVAAAFTLVFAVRAVARSGRAKRRDGSEFLS